MQADMPVADESTRRLRALIRALLSHGIWAIIALQLLMGVVMRTPVGEGGAMAAMRTALLLAATLGVLYGTAGMSAALAASRDPVPIAGMVTAGRPVFGAFLWLVVKAGLLALAVLQVVLTITIAMSHQEPAQAIAQLPSFMLPLAAILGFVLVYWMPVVFHRRDFRLLATLAEALRLARSRLSAAGFLALLTLAPPALAWALDGRGGAPAAFVLQVMASLLAWAAYIYCVEWLQDTGTPQSPPVS